jgi:hypothetical protein
MDQISVLVFDNGNGGVPSLFASGFMIAQVTCGNVAAPILSSVRLSNSLTSLQFTFDRPFVMSVLPTDALAPMFRSMFRGLTAFALPCSFALSSAQLLLGTGAFCVQTGPNEMTAFMTSGANINVGSSIALTSGIFRSCDSSTSSTTNTTRTVLTPSNPPIPSVRLISILIYCF